MGISREMCSSRIILFTVPSFLNSFLNLWIVSVSAADRFTPFLISIRKCTHSHSVNVLKPVNPKMLGLC